MGYKRVFLTGICIFIQLLFTYFLLVVFGKSFAILEIVYFLIGILIILAIIRDTKSINVDLTWIMFIILMPLLGAFLYLLVGNTKFTSSKFIKIKKSYLNSKKYLKVDERLLEKVDKTNYKSINYLAKNNFPLYENNYLEYYSLGENAYKKMLEELRKAKKFIFLEYFIIAPGKMWDSILDILVGKVKNGVEVRVIYDDMGCVNSFYNGYDIYLEQKGIKCICFNKLIPFLAMFMNNRDHRKILVIDGKVAFTGGMNLSDEYINEKKRFGYWKDNALMIKGRGVFSLTVMFLEVWNAYRKEDIDFTKYKVSTKDVGTGLIIPYSSDPITTEKIGESVYLNIINSAEKYLYVFTPYLIIDDTMIKSLCLASKSGIDVRILVPGIPDKKLIYELSKSYFDTLFNAGVKIYTFTNGFLHSKVFLSDDKIATVGTINLDYRSLYLHFECGVLIYDNKVLKDIKEDFNKTIDESHLITKKEVKYGIFRKIWQAILRLFAPLT